MPAFDPTNPEARQRLRASVEGAVAALSALIESKGALSYPDAQAVLGGIEWPHGPCGPADDTHVRVERILGQAALVRAGKRHHEEEIGGNNQRRQRPRKHEASPGDAPRAAGGDSDGGTPEGQAPSGDLFS